MTAVSTRPSRPTSSVPVGARTEIPAEEPSARYFLTLCLGALGVVYGDIGTSPLYAMRECFHPSHGLAVTTPNVLGLFR